MEKNLTCIECPQGCCLLVTLEEGIVSRVEGAKCSKGEQYAKEECVNPVRILTSSVVTEGLSLQLLSVKTNKTIPKVRIFDAMEEIRNLRINKPVECGDVISSNFLGLNVDLVATRSVFYLS